MKRSSWITVVVAGLVAAASITFFWFNKPEWGYCIEEGPNRGCETGEFLSNAMAGSMAVGVGLVLLLVGMLIARDRRAVMIAAVAVFVVLLVVAWALQITPLEEVPMPIEPHIN